jgi:hypothetical protein
MFQTMKKPTAESSLKTEIKDLTTADPSPRELTEEDVLYVAGGMMASRTTCSGGCADDCGL